MCSCTPFGPRQRFAPVTVTPERKLFKDWFDAASVRTLADQVARAWPAFDRRRFVRLANRDLTELELSGAR